MDAFVFRLSCWCIRWSALDGFSLKRDLHKLWRFAHLIGIPILRTKGAKRDAATFVYEGKKSRVELHLDPAKDSTEDTLILLHELGHAVDWIEAGRGARVPGFLTVGKILTRKERYLYWNNERRGIQNMKFLYDLLQLELPRHRLETERMYDLWVYSFFYRKGKYPTSKNRIAKWKELNKTNKRLYQKGEIR